MLSLEFRGAQVLGADGLQDQALAIEGGLIAEAAERQVDLTGYTILPGIVDMHGDGFERHVAPRRGAMKDLGEGLRSAEVEMAANGITTGVLAQFISWEGGLRGPDFADQVFTALRETEMITQVIPQARFETHMLDLYDGLPARLAGWSVPYVVFNDHLPHDRLAAGKLPPRLAGQALQGWAQSRGASRVAAKPSRRTGRSAGGARHALRHALRRWDSHGQP